MAFAPATLRQADAAGARVIVDGGYDEASRHAWATGIAWTSRTPFLTASDETVLQPACFTVEPSIFIHTASRSPEDVVVVREAAGTTVRGIRGCTWWGRAI